MVLQRQELKLNDLNEAISMLIVDPRLSFVSGVQNVVMNDRRSCLLSRSTDTLQKDWKFHPYKVFDFHHSLADESNFVAVLLKQLMNVHSNQSSYTILTRSGRDCRRIDRIRNENKW